MDGKIVKVSGPLIVAEGMSDSKMYDVVRVSEQKLIGEIIAVSYTHLKKQICHLFIAQKAGRYQLAYNVVYVIAAVQQLSLAGNGFAVFYLLRFNERYLGESGQNAAAVLIPRCV